MPTYLKTFEYNSRALKQKFKNLICGVFFSLDSGVCKRVERQKLVHKLFEMLWGEGAERGKFQILREKREKKSNAYFYLCLIYGVKKGNKGDFWIVGYCVSEVHLKNLSFYEKRVVSDEFWDNLYSFARKQLTTNKTSKTVIIKIKKTLEERSFYDLSKWKDLNFNFRISSLDKMKRFLG